jgi:preprotein translocase subunit YajC
MIVLMYVIMIVPQRRKDKKMDHTWSIGINYYRNF